jgi:hypothetical protein
VDVDIHFLSAAAATAEKLAAEHEDCSDHNENKNYEYSHDCGVAAATITVSHKFSPPLHLDSGFILDVIVSAAPNLFIRTAQGRKAETKNT